jgi:hypothetical protein
MYVPDHVYATPGATTIVPFQWSWSCYAAGGRYIYASDTQGWVTSWSPPSGADNETCTPCVIPRYDGEVELTIPPGTPEGTTSTVTLSTDYYEEVTFIVEAQQPVQTESTTWGRIKALYR